MCHLFPARPSPQPPSAAALGPLDTGNLCAAVRVCQEGGVHTGGKELGEMLMISWKIYSHTREKCYGFESASYLCLSV